MPTTIWSVWDDDILTDIPGAKQEFVRHHLKLAAIEFCKLAWVWLIDQAVIPVVAGTNSYSWTSMPAGTAVARVLQVWIEKRQIFPKTRNELSDIYGDYMRAEGPSRYFIADLPSKIILVPKPSSDIADGITAKFAVAPTRAATGVETEIFDRYFDAISKGAKARIFGIKRKPWTDMDKATEQRVLFEDAISEAKTNVIRSFAGARLRNRAQFF